MIRVTAPVYVNKYAVTIQSRLSKPLKALVIETSEVLTIVVSTVDKNSAIHMLFHQGISMLSDCMLVGVSLLTQQTKHEVSILINIFSSAALPPKPLNGLL